MPNPGCAPGSRWVRCDLYTNSRLLSSGRFAAGPSDRLPCPLPTATPSGRHFLQIPGPTNVPDRVLRAIDRPTIDHRGPEFGELGKTVLAGHEAGLRDRGRRRHLPGLRHRRVGSGAGQHALARRPRADGRDRPLRHAVAASWPSGWRSPSSSCPATGATAPTPPRSRRGCAPTRRTRSRRSASCTTRPRPASTSRIAAVRAAIDRAGHPALLMVDTICSLGSIDYRHDEWGVDVTVGGSQKGLMLPPGLSFNAISREGARRARVARSCRARTGTGRRCSRPTRPATSPTRRRPTCSTASPRRSTCCSRKGWPTCSRATTATPRRRGARCAPGASRSCAPNPPSTARR